MQVKVLLAMSGGVDSSVAALLLKKEGYQVVGIHFVLHENADDVETVEKNAGKLGIDLHVENISKKFQDEVVDYVVREYESNRTPNPCVKCNRKIKFDMLGKFAEKYGCGKIATGHYARIDQKKDGSFSLMKAIDETKDQSYYLYRLIQKDLEKIIFPLGEHKKKKMKKMALEAGLETPEKESQDICFLSSGEKVNQFLQKQLSKKQKEGEIVDEEGKLLGKHPGLVFYTLGQRKGLDLSGGPYFVIGKNAGKNQLIVSKEKKHPFLQKKEIKFNDVSWTNNPPEKEKKYSIKTRYQGLAKHAIIKKENDIWQAELEMPVWAPAPGQSLVIYDGEEIIGGGTITD